MTREHPRRRRLLPLPPAGYEPPADSEPTPHDREVELLTRAINPTEEEADRLSQAARDAIAWDQAAAAEPFQLDVTREYDDTTRIGNGLSAALRLELLTQGMREDALDGRIPRDPVDGAELDPVDGLPVQAEREPETVELPRFDPGTNVPQVDPAPWETPADLFASLTPQVYAAPAPAVPWEEHEHVPQLDGRCAICGHQLPRELPEEEAPDSIDPEQYLTNRLGSVVVVDPARAVNLRGARARVLNWTSRHDERSLAYGVRAKLRAPAPLVDRVWEHGPILDQGTTPPLSLHDASGCTGMAAVNARNVLELATLPAGRRQDADLMDEADAMRIYDRAQELDELPGEAYPGTSILALMKAGQEIGAWGTYLWAFGTRDVAQALLQVGPVIVGIPWRSQMATPGPDGIITVAGDDLGGHAMCLHAIRMKVAGRAGPWFGALQTWGEEIGDGGVVWIHHKDLARLLAGVGEAAIPLTEFTAMGAGL